MKSTGVSQWLRFNLPVEVTAEKDLKPEATAEVGKELDGISDLFR